MVNVAISLAVIASFALFGYGVHGLWKRRPRRPQYWLMIAVALVTLINAYLLATMPKPT